MQTKTKVRSRSGSVYSVCRAPLLRMRFLHLPSQLSGGTRSPIVVFLFWYRVVCRYVRCCCCRCCSFLAVARCGNKVAAKTKRPNRADHFPQRVGVNGRRFKRYRNLSIAEFLTGSDHIKPANTTRSKMARKKQTARKSAGGPPPRKRYATKTARMSVAPEPAILRHLWSDDDEPEDEPAVAPDNSATVLDDRKPAAQKPPPAPPSEDDSSNAETAVTVATTTTFKPVPPPPPPEARELAKGLREELKCCICFEILDYATCLVPCGHNVCSGCIPPKPSCPICRKEIKHKIPNIALNNIVDTIVRNQNGSGLVVFSDESLEIHSQRKDAAPLRRRYKENTRRFYTSSYGRIKFSGWMSLHPSGYGTPYVRIGSSAVHPIEIDGYNGYRYYGSSGYSGSYGYT